jgi:hypothetical protein
VTNLAVPIIDLDIVTTVTQILLMSVGVVIIEFNNLTRNVGTTRSLIGTQISLRF